MAEFAVPSPEDIAYLKANPGVAEKFDVKFGPGSSNLVIGASEEGAPVASLVTSTPPAGGGLTVGRAAMPEAAPAPDHPAGDTQAVPEEAEGGAGIMANLAEIPSAIASGVIEAGKEGAEFLASMVGVDAEANREDVVSSTISSLPIIGDVVNLFGDADETAEAITPNRPVTLAGGITEGVTQFLAGMALSGGVGGGVAKGIAASAASTAFFFDPRDGNLQNFLQDNDWAVPGVTAYLAVDEANDSEGLMRLKNSLDGLMADAVLLSFVKVVKASKLYFKGEAVGGEAGDALKREATDLAEEASLDGERMVDEGIPQVVPEREVTNIIPERETTNIIPEPPQAPTIGTTQIREAGEVAAEITAGKGSAKAGSYLSVDRMREAVALRGDITPEMLAETDVFNMSKVDGPIEAQQLIETFGQALEDSGAFKAWGIGSANPEALAVTTAKSAKEVASITGRGAAKFMRDLEAKALSAQDSAKTLLTAKTLLLSLGRELNVFATTLDNAAIAGRNTPEMEVRLIEMMETFTNVQTHTNSLRTEAARATSAGRIRVGDGLDATALDKIEAFGGSQRIQDLAKRMRAAKGPNQLARLARRGRRDTKLGAAMDVVNEYWINSILSGYQTHMVNITSNAINIALLPMERVLGGISQGVRGQGFGQMREGFYQYTALRGSVMDSLRMAGRSFVDESSVLDVATKLDHAQGGRKAIAPETFGVKPDSVGGSIISGMGKSLRLSTRFLMAEDEFFKQVAFRSRLKARLMEASNTADLRKLGYDSKGAYVEGEFDKAFNRLEDLEVEFQKLVDLGRVQDDAALKEAFIKENLGGFKAGNADAEDALRVARTATFTTPLDPTSFSGDYQKLANRHPVLRQITPFIQTPTNIIAAGWDRTPVLSLLRRRFRDQLRSADPAIRAEAEGKLATGVALATGAYMLSYEGRITGGGPVEPRMAAVWKADPNWQPYSLNIGTIEEPHWVAFDRMDPHGFLFGIMADVMEMRQMAEMDPSFDDATLFAMAAASAAANLKDGTYLQGMSEVFELMESRDMPSVWDSWLKNRTASFVPFSSFGGQLNKALEPHAKDARTYVDTILSKVPGMSGDIPTRHSWLTGEAIDNPSHWLGYIREKQAKKDVVGTELRKLGYGFGGPDRKLGEIELSPEVFQQWNQLMGSVKRGGKTLHQRLESVMAKDRYDLGGVGYDATSPAESHRTKMLSKWITKYKGWALQELKDLHPDLADGAADWKDFKKKAQLGRAAPDGSDRENLMLNY